MCASKCTVSSFLEGSRQLGVGKQSYSSSYKRVFGGKFRCFARTAIEYEVSNFGDSTTRFSRTPIPSRISTPSFRHLRRTPLGGGNDGPANFDSRTPRMFAWVLAAPFSVKIANLWRAKENNELHTHRPNHVDIRPELLHKNKTQKTKQVTNARSSLPHTQRL